MQPKITTLFLDIGGVLLSNGWDRTSRKLAAEHFKLDLAEMNERHHLTFDTYELGKISLDEYLNRIVFYEPHTFSKEDFRNFMFSQSTILEDSIAYFKELKQEHNLKVIAVNNEGKELNEHRIKTFKLYELFDGFISSCYVNFRKPDKDIFLMACGISQTKPHHAIHIDDRLMFVEVARSVGVQGLHYKGLEAAKEEIKTLSF